MKLISQHKSVALYDNIAFLHEFIEKFRLRYDLKLIKNWVCCPEKHIKLFTIFWFSCLLFCYLLSMGFRISIEAHILKLSHSRDVNKNSPAANQDKCYFGENTCDIKEEQLIVCVLSSFYPLTIAYFFELYFIRAIFAQYIEKHQTIVKRRQMISYYNITL